MKNKCRFSTSKEQTFNGDLFLFQWLQIIVLSRNRSEATWSAARSRSLVTSLRYLAVFAVTRVIPSGQALCEELAGAD